MNNHDACKALLKIMDEAYGAPVVTSFPEEKEKVEAEQLNEAYYAGPEAMPGAMGAPSEETNVSYSQTKRIGDATVSVNANAKSMEELHKVLALAGLEPSAADKYAEPDEPEAEPAAEPDVSPCGADRPSMAYSTDKSALVDMIKQKLQQKLS